MDNKKYIGVSRERFYEILSDDRYIKEPQIEDPTERSSCPYYNVIDKDTNEVVAIYSDGSWENTFEVIVELASKEDIISHYERIVKWNEYEIGLYKLHNKKLKGYKNLSPEERAEQDKKELEEAERRKSQPGLLQFLEEDNLIKYTPGKFTVFEGIFTK